MASGEMLLDEQKIPHSAKYTAATWQWGGLPCANLTLPEGARDLFSAVNAYMKFYRFINPAKHSLQHTLLHRHAIINRLLERSGIQQVIEVAAGFSPRGASVSRRENVVYFEVDLPDVVSLKKQQLAKTQEGREVLQRSSFKQIAGDALKLDFKALFPNQKSFVITEGLMMYFTREEQMAIWKNIAAFMQVQGGEYTFDYIPVDVEPKRSLLGRVLHTIKKALGGDKQGYCYDERTRWQVRDDLLQAGFQHVDVVDSSEVASVWELPFAEEKTQVIVYHCHS